ncbi:MAG: hypothetical protein GXX96_10350 [Planctomycetaceae bacterium]|nr:hypothetical protein [Planctomycetaceae bacterium]
MTRSRRRPSRPVCAAVIAALLTGVPERASADGFFTNLREDVRSTESAGSPRPD